jgi:hypothetical protein
MGENIMHSPIKTLTPTSATGFTCHRVTPKKKRAFIAASFYRNPKVTIRLVARMWGISPSYLKTALAADADRRFAVLNGIEALVPSGRPERLAAHIKRSSPAELVEAAQEVGVGKIWESMIVPLV